MDSQLSDDSWITISTSTSQSSSIQYGCGPAASPRSKDSEQAMMEALSCVGTCCQQIRWNDIPVLQLAVPERRCSWYIRSTLYTPTVSPAPVCHSTIIPPHTRWLKFSQECPRLFTTYSLGCVVCVWSIHSFGTMLRGGHGEMHEARILPVDALTHKGKENTSCESRRVLATHSRKVTVSSQLRQSLRSGKVHVIPFSHERDSKEADEKPSEPY